MPIRDIENHLERCDARIERADRIEAVRERRKVLAKQIKTTVGIIAALCAVYTVYMQF